MASADELKAQGNAAFQSGDAAGAVELFSQAIDADPSNHVLYSNRSAAYAKLSQYHDAAHDAQCCVSLQPQWVKGHSRLALAMFRLGDFAGATSAYKRALALDPGSADLQKGLALAEQEEARLRAQFEKWNDDTYKEMKQSQEQAMKEFAKTFPRTYSFGSSVYLYAALAYAFVASRVAGPLYERALKPAYTALVTDVLLPKVVQPALGAVGKPAGAAWASVQRFYVLKYLPAYRRQIKPAVKTVVANVLVPTWERLLVPLWERVLMPVWTLYVVPFWNSRARPALEKAVAAAAAGLGAAWAWAQAKWAEAAAARASKVGGAKAGSDSKDK